MRRFFIACYLENHYVRHCRCAADLEMLNVEIALANRPKTAIEFTSKCHYCEETISKVHFFSDECRTDHEHIQHALLNQKAA